MTAGQIGYPQIKALALMAPAAALRDDALRGSTMGAVYDPLNVPAEGIKLPWGGQMLGRDYITTAKPAYLWTIPLSIPDRHSSYGWQTALYLTPRRTLQPNAIKGVNKSAARTTMYSLSHSGQTTSKVADLFSHSLSKNKTAYHYKSNY